MLVINSLSFIVDLFDVAMFDRSNFFFKKKSIFIFESKQIRFQLKFNLFYDGHTFFLLKDTNF